MFRGRQGIILKFEYLNKNSGKCSLVDIRWLVDGDKILYYQRVDDDNHYRDSFWHSNNQTCFIGIMALWQKSGGQRRFRRLFKCDHEYFMAAFRRFLHLPHSLVIRTTVLHHDYWYPFRETTF